MESEEVRCTRMGFCRLRLCTPLARKGRMTLASIWVPSGVCERKHHGNTLERASYNISGTIPGQRWAREAAYLDLRQFKRSLRLTLQHSLDCSNQNPVHQAVVLTR